MAFSPENNFFHVQIIEIKIIFYQKMRLARLKFELTNQDSAGGKNFTVLSSM